MKILTRNSKSIIPGERQYRVHGLHPRQRVRRTLDHLKSIASTCTWCRPAAYIYQFPLEASEALRPTGGYFGLYVGHTVEYEFEYEYEVGYGQGQDVE